MASLEDNELSTEAIEIWYKFESHNLALNNLLVFMTKTAFNFFIFIMLYQFTNLDKKPSIFQFVLLPPRPALFPGTFRSPWWWWTSETNEWTAKGHQRNWENHNILTVLQSRIMSPLIMALTHWPWGKMANILQTSFSNVCCWMKIFVFWFKFHQVGSQRIQLTKWQHWFR